MLKKILQNKKKLRINFIEKKNQIIIYNSSAFSFQLKKGDVLKEKEEHTHFVKKWMNEINVSPTEN